MKSATFAGWAVVAILSCATMPAWADDASTGAQSTTATQDVKDISHYLQSLATVRSACADAAWTLWQSNNYDSWRHRRTSVLAMNYNVQTLSTLPQAPTSLPADLQQRLNAAMQKANDTVKASFPVFKDLANYINAEDYKSDKFKKGDELDARLIDFGKTCHTASNDLRALYVEAASAAIDKGLPGAPRADVARTMLADWQQAYALSQELGKGGSIDLKKIDADVSAISALADKRRTEFADDIAKDGSPVANFYDRDLNENVAVPLRKALRDMKGKPAELKEAAADRPRADFLIIRQQIDLTMLADILRFVGG
ncbi:MULTISPECIES: DUF3829 domain-containing protein [unclassified Rhizobium]|jgi:hypothetical protein|uniref:DUF3829 domain-containing protein n=1 Tax=unclassified Rhizobium TaxID=2613769 RepID=UPI0009E05881|nr:MULTISPECIES: DUF3829 domain-containing protein [unclassified Rhizobium]MBN8953656.1 DUF3829 domain-containing protein [Rhizobium tropici]RKD56081.1 uncharacterized protein DUF3829 [Rhizobium sp. WW_1]